MDRSRSSSFVNGQRPSLPQTGPLDFNPELTNGFDNSHNYLTVDGFDSNPSFNRFDPLGAFVSPADHQRMLQNQQDQQNIMMQAYEIQQSQAQSQSQLQTPQNNNNARRSVSASRKENAQNPLSLNTDRRVSPRPSQLHLQTQTQTSNEFEPFANALDSQLLSANWDPTIDTSKNIQHGSIDPAQLFSNGSHFGSTSPSAPQSNDISPSSASNPYLSATMSRNPSQNLNLDPATAALGNPGFTENWSDLRNRASFQHHRRGNSDALSDVSSLAPSPYLETVNFEAGFENASPLLQANDDTEDFSQGLDVGNISLGSTNGLNGAPTYPMSMQQGGNFQMSNFDLDQNAYALGLDLNGLDTAFPGLDTEPPAPEMGNADVMTPPEIQVDLAEPTKPMEQGGRHKSGALSPPDRGRVRSISDPYSRQFPVANKPLSANGADPRRRSLSPYDPKLLPGQAKSESKLSTTEQRRRSTSMISDRGHVLDLADPTRSTIGASQRVRKHPAIYTCDLCPKSFTRAYNLRSHHRTHTDERPFVCTDCGKAFARQHDRKRHEALHTGEKKFVCKGELQNGGQWGCGRRFARADALGRHFRSEAGGTCIKPLLEEEAMEKNAAAAFNNQMLAAQSANMPSSFGFPAALLAQFPDLQGFQWNNSSAFDADPSFLDEDDGYLSAYSNSGAAEPSLVNVNVNQNMGGVGVGDATASLGPNWMPGAGVGVNVNANGSRWPVMNGNV